MDSIFDLIDTKALDKKLENGEYPFSENLFTHTTISFLNNSLN